MHCFKIDHGHGPSIDCNRRLIGYDLLYGSPNFVAGKTRQLVPSSLTHSQSLTKSPMGS